MKITLCLVNAVVFAMRNIQTKMIYGDIWNQTIASKKLQNHLKTQKTFQSFEKLFLLL